MSKTDIIRYNLADRGRTARGQDRNFDLVMAARIINGAEVQERVKHGDMIGYFGHWPRVKYGVQPPEGVMDNGRMVPIIPALRTTFIQADEQGNVDHQVEFLNTTQGKVAARMWASNSGGFSSAINTRMVGNKAVPTGFFGFDFVLEPNYTTNRGYGVALDGVMGGEDMLLDAAQEQQEVMQRCLLMLDSMQQQYDRLLQDNARLLNDQDELLDRLARGATTLQLDAVMAVTHQHVHTALDSAEDFLTANLVGIAQPPAEKKPRPTGITGRMLSKFGL